MYGVQSCNVSKEHKRSIPPNGQDLDDQVVSHVTQTRCQKEEYQIVVHQPFCLHLPQF